MASTIVPKGCSALVGIFLPLAKCLRTKLQVEPSTLHKFKIGSTTPALGS